MQTKTEEERHANPLLAAKILSTMNSADVKIVGNALQIVSDIDHKSSRNWRRPNERPQMSFKLISSSKRYGLT